MKVLLILSLTVSAGFLVACQPSGTAKKEMEKFSGTPTPYPTLQATPEETPINAADIVQVDTSLDGDTLSVNGQEEKKAPNCTKYNNVMINGNAIVVTVKGVCRRIVINGDGSKITADAATEFVFNGTGNTLTYSHFINGKRPVVTQNSPGNTVEQVSAAAVKKAPEQKQAK